VNSRDIAALKTLTDPTRLRIAGYLADKPATLDDVAAGIGGRRGDLVRHIGLLRDAGVIGDDESGRLVLRQDTLIALGRELDAMHRAAEHRADAAFAAGEGVDPADAKVLRAFIVDGRLASIPATEKKRLVVLRYLCQQCFTEDRPYPEKEVNQRLALFHPDVASLRRHMVDAGLMTREAGEYRRGVELLAPRANSTT
jgi:hypothetical protein